MLEALKILQNNIETIPFSNQKKGLPSMDGQKVAPLFIRKLDQTIYKATIDNLDDKKVFLDPGLSLAKLSMMVGTNTTYLSNVINTYLHCNFKTLVNQYRIEHCKKLLENEEEITMKELPVRCGFSSLSAFYAAFKKYTGISPKDYHKQFNPLETESIETIF